MDLDSEEPVRSVGSFCLCETGSALRTYGQFHHLGKLKSASEYLGEPLTVIASNLWICARAMYTQEPHPFPGVSCLQWTQ